MNFYYVDMVLAFLTGICLGLFIMLVSLEFKGKVDGKD